MKDTIIRVSFKSRNQMPYMMITKEYYEFGKIVHAEVLYQEEEKQSTFIVDES
jgi:hypothetical protein